MKVFLNVWTERLLECLNRVCIWIAGACILAMVVMGGFDVISTAVVGKPIPSVYEATETLLVVAVFLTLGVLHRSRANISVDIVYLRLGRSGRRAVDLLTLLLSGGFFAVIAWRGWVMAWHSWKIGEYSVGIVPFPVYPAKFALAVGASLAALLCVVDLARGGASPPTDERP